MILHSRTPRRTALGLAALIAIVVLAIATFIVLRIWSTMSHKDAADLGQTAGIAVAFFAWLALTGIIVQFWQVGSTQADQAEQMKRLGEIAHKLSDRVESAEKEIAALEGIARALVDPYVVMRVATQDSTVFVLIIENTGRSPAYDIRFESVEPKVGLKLPGAAPIRELSEQQFVNEGVAMLAPGEAISVIVGEGGHNRLQSERGEEWVEKMRIQYSYSKRPRSEQYGDIRVSCFYEHDFGQHLSGTFQYRDPTSHELHRLNQLLKDGKLVVKVKS